MTGLKKIYKWFARTIGGLAVIFFVLLLLGASFPAWNEILEAQPGSMLILLAFAAMGYLFAWFREKEGGIVMTIAALVMGMNMFYYGGLTDSNAALIFALPFLLPGLIFWWVGRNA